MFTKRFWLDACERAVKTFAQFMLASGALDVVSGDFETTVRTKAVGALLAAGMSVLSSLASSRVGDSPDASAVP